MATPGPGRKAAWRALENALPQLKDDKSLHFLFLPEAHDPDSYIRAHGKAQFEDALLNQSKPLSAYFWDGLSDGLDLNAHEGKAELVKTSAPLLAQISAPALGFLLKQQLSELVGIDPANLAQLLGQEAPKRHIKQKSYQLPQGTARQPQMPTLVQKQIRSLLINPAWAASIALPEYLPLSGDMACLANVAEFDTQPTRTAEQRADFRAHARQRARSHAQPHFPAGARLVRRAGQQQRRRLRELQNGHAKAVE